MKALAVDEYDLAGQEAILEIPNGVVTAFQPVTFNTLGYPSKIRKESELFKYIDVMHDNEFLTHFNDRLKGLTPSEFETLTFLTKASLSFSMEKFNKKIIARASILGALNVFRHMSWIVGDDKPRVLEIGPGCGYLGAMLMLGGWTYSAMDVSQAFYLYQNHFWNSILEGGIEELAYSADVEPHKITIPNHCVHIPWWHFVKLLPETVPEIDIITCNRVLCEMSPHSLKFVLKIARAMLRGNNGRKAIVFEGWGAQAISKVEFVLKEFFENEFVIAHHDPLITVYVPKESQDAAGYVIYSYTGDSEDVQQPVYCSPNENPLSLAIVQGRQSIEGKKIVGLDRINAFYTEILGDSDHGSPDEKFLRLIGEI